jgi:ribonuclease III
MELTRERLEAIVGFKVSDFNVYKQAFRHKSMADHSNPSYERAEFMGDAVINFIVTRFLFDKYGDKDEGFLTKIRTKVVSGKCLSGLAKKLGLHELVEMNEKAMTNGWNHNDRILEDVFESLVGCIYLDIGMIPAREFLIGVIQKHVNFTESEKDDNYKDILMRYTQAGGIPLPDYKSVEVMQDGKKVFEIHTYVNGVPSGYGRHKSKKQAEQLSARQALLYHGVPLEC